MLYGLNGINELPLAACGLLIINYVFKWPSNGEKCSGGGRVADEPIDRLMWPDAILSRRSNAVFIIQMYLNHSWKKVGILATGCRR